MSRLFKDKVYRLWGEGTGILFQMQAAPMILPWVDYSRGAFQVKPEDAVSLFLGAFKMHGTFSYAQLLSLCNKDQAMLALESRMAERFARAANHNSLWPWETEGRDCDDQEAMFRADRVKARWRAGLKAPEAFGGIYYLSRSRRGWHWASWAIVNRGGVLAVRIYQPDTDEWQEPGEAVEVEYFDA